MPAPQAEGLPLAPGQGGLGISETGASSALGWRPLNCLFKSVPTALVLPYTLGPGLTAHGVRTALRAVPGSRSDGRAGRRATPERVFGTGIRAHRVCPDVLLWAGGQCGPTEAWGPAESEPRELLRSFPASLFVLGLPLSKTLLQGTSFMRTHFPLGFISVSTPDRGQPPAALPTVPWHWAGASAAPVGSPAPPLPGLTLRSRGRCISAWGRVQFTSRMRDAARCRVTASRRRVHRKLSAYPAQLFPGFAANPSHRVLALWATGTQ